jgi:tRNA-2-methylthio-N6-dimethylallyladenosine synthase
MRRRYDAGEYRALVDRLRSARPDIALTTDLIVGFPGETDAEFRATLELVKEVGFVDAFSFKYSPRPGTAAAELTDGVPADVAQERLEALQQQLHAQTGAAHRARVGDVTQVLVTGVSRRGDDQLTGRDPYHRVVNFAAPPGAAVPTPGDLVPVRIVAATPHSLIGERIPEETGFPTRRSLKGGSLIADEEGRGRMLDGASPTGN